MNQLASVNSASNFKPAYENTWSTWWTPQELQTTPTDLEKIKQTLNHFVHELRTPLTILMTASAMLDEPSLRDVRSKNLLKAISNNCSRLNDLIGDYAQLVELGNEHSQITRSPLYLHDFLNDLVRGFTLLANDNKLKVKFTPPSSELKLNLDAKILNQVLHNLLSNALRFATTEIELSVAQNSRGEWVFSVSDDGAGIAADKLGEIFSPYVQLAKKTDASGYAGSGLGLAIVQALVKKHQGRIWVESTLGKGTSFHFVLGT